ncbi:alditol oxidase-like [Clytia hemisphaerica]|uniref:alditol oxidase-like n=1 Tax=Clytia hemisphaerica TaxID=252671 RepID=UPI0034D52F27
MARSDLYAKNWSENVTYTSDIVLFPNNTPELQRIIKDVRYAKLKVIGTRHCFNTIADTGHNTDLETGETAHICLENMTLTYFDKVVIGGEEDLGLQPVVTFGAGMTYSKLIDIVDAEGFAIQNLPSLPHINVVGSMITGTHGSGHKYQILTTQVVAFDMVFANGKLESLSKPTTPDFTNYLINFGGLGVITSMTIKLVPTFMVSKSIYKNLKWDILFDKNYFDNIMHHQDFLSCFCTWKTREMSSVWVGKKYYEGDPLPVKEIEYFGAKHITGNRIHPVPGRDSSVNVTTGVGKWRDKIYHFLPDKPPSSAGNEIQTEFFVPYEHFINAMEALYLIKDKFQHLVQVSEFRMVLEDNLPMSPAKHQTCIGIHFTWWREHDKILSVLPLIESTLSKFNVKPHFGKLFQMSGPKFENLYGSDLDKLRALCYKHDPTGKFRNNFMEKYIFTSRYGKMTTEEEAVLCKKHFPIISKL